MDRLSGIEGDEVNGAPNTPKPIRRTTAPKKSLLEEALALERAMSQKQAGSRPTPLADNALTGASLLIGGN
jgi:hypothetical protein